MSCPFIGVDPYLEGQGLWPDFHSKFINYWQEALAEILPENYEVRIGERVNLTALPAEKIKRIRPHISISQHKPSSRTVPSGGVSTFEAVTIPLVIEEETRETYIEILQRPDRILVAVLELLSPSNKEEPGRSDYLARRNTLLNHPLHLVELDLLLAGRRLPLAKDYPPGDYFALVVRSDSRPDCHVYHWHLQQKIPTIPIPLRVPDADVMLDLSAVFALTYERGRYVRSIDYSVDPQLPVYESQLFWIRAEAAKAKRHSAPE